jgi:hypothetical protein
MHCRRVADGVWCDSFSCDGYGTVSALPEGLIDSTVVQAAGSLIDKERRIGRAWQHLQALMLVLLQCLAGGITQGHPACLSEFAFCDMQ